MEPFLGQIQFFGCNFPPRGWAQCDGQLLDIASNTALFSLLGTIYGGDGRTSFGLPDLRGRVSMMYNQGPGLTSRRIGERGGVESVLLTNAQLPSHTHQATGSVASSSSPGDEDSPVDNHLAAHTVDENYAATADDSMAAGGVQVSLSSGGGGQSHPNVQPYSALTCCIALQGTYPSRS